MKRDYYEILGIPRTSGEKDIKKAFRDLARQIHPDVNKSDPEAEAKFKEAAEAYEVLSNPETRATYDSFGHDGLKRGGFQDFSQFSFEDIIRSFFSGSLFGEEMFGFSRRGPVKGQDAVVVVSISLEEAARGVERELEYEAVDNCEACSGSGAAPGASRKACSACGGSGQVQSVQRTPFGQFVQRGPCLRCGGRGSTVEKQCPECRGRGLANIRKKLTVEIPAGIADGQSIRLLEKGSAGENGGRPGDLYVQVHVEPHEQLIRDGDDLIYHLPLTMTDAAVGATLTVPTLEDKEEIAVKAGTQPGELKVVKGKGMPFLRGRGRGDLKIIMDVMIPHHLSTEQKKLLKQFAGMATDKNYTREEGLIEKLKAAFR